MNIKHRIAVCVSTLTIIATIVDWVVIKNDMAFHGYHYLGWSLVWLISFSYLRSFSLGLGCTLLIALFEDILFLEYEALMVTRCWYPLYQHQWIPEAYGRWATFLSHDWLGMPSYYYIACVAGTVLLLIGLKRAGSQNDDNSMASKMTRTLRKISLNLKQRSGLLPKTYG